MRRILVLIACNIVCKNYAFKVFFFFGNFFLFFFLLLLLLLLHLQLYYRVKSKLKFMNVGSNKNHLKFFVYFTVCFQFLSFIDYVTATNVVNARYAIFFSLPLLLHVFNLHVITIISMFWYLSTMNFSFLEIIHHFTNSYETSFIVHLLLLYRQCSSQ